MKRTAALFSVCSLLAFSAGCGLFSVVDTAPEAKCRPATLDKRGDFLWAPGHTTAQGWKVTTVDDSHIEFIRIGFEKGGTTTTLEVAFNEDGPGDWATEKYRLMPAPGETPPEDLLLDAIGELRAHAKNPEDDAFVRRSEGLDGRYEGLPPCEE